MYQSSETKDFIDQYRSTEPLRALEQFNDLNPAADDSARYCNINKRIGISKDWPS